MTTTQQSELYKGTVPYVKTGPYPLYLCNQSRFTDMSTASEDHASYGILRSGPICANDIYRL